MTTLIKVGDNCGLCNRLFPFANLITYACTQRVQILHAAFSEYAAYFEGTAGHTIPTFPPPQTWRSTVIPWTGTAFRLGHRILRKFHMQPAIVLGSDDVLDLSDDMTSEHLRSMRTVQLIGFYFHDSRNFDRHADIVRAYFRPVAAIRLAVDRVISEAGGNGDVVVGVHIRHGDYQTFADGMMFYTIPEYFELMQQVQELFPGRRVAFLVSSNVPVTPAMFPGLAVVCAPGHPVTDLYALSACDYLIGPPSTYSEWASFYGRVPRYQHRKNRYLRLGETWPGVSLEDFETHRTGFGRCSATHKESLTRPSAQA